MQAAPNAMTGEIPNRLETVRLRGTLNRSTDSVDGSTRFSLGECIFQGQLSGVAQARLKLGYRRNDDRSTGIGEIASKLCGDIDVNNIPCLNNSRSWNAVRGLLIDTYARG